MGSTAGGAQCRWRKTVGVRGAIPQFGSPALCAGMHRQPWEQGGGARKSLHPHRSQRAKTARTTEITEDTENTFVLRPLCVLCVLGGECFCASPRRTSFQRL